MATTTPAGIIPTHAPVSVFRANPTTPPFSDDQQWITAYMTIHMMSPPSYRVMYLLWFLVAFVFLAASSTRWFRVNKHSLGAFLSKWALRKRTLRNSHAYTLVSRPRHSHRQPPLFLSNAQLLAVLFLFVIGLTLSFVGPDYIAPQVGLFTFFNDAPVANIRRRDFYDTSDFVMYQPQYTIPKAWWTVGGRTGLIAFAILPLCVLLGLKAPPFALFSIPFTVQIHFDKLSALHRWSGRFIWFLVAIHVAAWSMQLAKDSGSLTGKTAYSYAWQYDRFICGWIAFTILTLIMIFSIPLIRRHHYEAFYFLHVLLVPLMLVTSALHHPPLQAWAYGALVIWICERLWRALWWLHTNGCFGGIVANMSLTIPVPSRYRDREEMEMKALNSRYFPSPRSADSSFARIPSPQSSSAMLFSRMPSPTTEQFIYPRSSYIPPPGYGHAELLPGRTVRVTVITPVYRSWSPGQHFLISLPCVSKFTSHPFTTASVCDDQSSTDIGRLLVFLIRAKAGWTKDLWDAVIGMTVRGQSNPANETLPDDSLLPPHGVLMRAFVEGPFGSVTRTDWDSHSTAVIVTGGSGVSFGLSILVYLCLCLSGRDGKHLGNSHWGFGRSKFSVTRVRFVWLVREFCHIQWCASVLRQCTSLVTSPVVQVDIFVTNIHPSPHSHVLSNRQLSPQLTGEEMDDRYLMPHRSAIVPNSPSQLNSPQFDDDDAYGGLIDLSYYTGGSTQDVHTEWSEWGAHGLDLTNFDGDDDTALPGEAQLSYRLKKEGMIRRARTRKLTKSLRVRDGKRPDSFESDDDEHEEVARSAQKLVTPANPTVYHDDISRPTRLLASKLTLDTINIHRHPSSSGMSPSHSATLSWDAAGDSASMFDAGSDAHNIAALMPQTGVGAYGEEVSLDFDEREIDDVRAVAEYARPGQPKLDLLLAEEVEGSKGSLIVACCGPASLNAVMRRCVAAEIDPGRIRKGDMRGSITFVAEDFEY